jgi:PAS domain S-box-containing protein
MDAVTALEPTRRADQIEKWFFALSAVGLGMLVLIGLIADWTLRQVKDSDLWVDHTYAVLNESQQLLADLKDAESATRAYVILPEDRYQQEAKRATAGIPASFASLRSLTADNKGQQDRLHELGPLLNARVATLNEIIRVRNEQGFEAVTRLRNDESLRRVADRTPQVARDIQTEERRLLQQRTALRSTRLRQGLMGTLGATSFALIALIVAPIQVRRAVRQRNSAHREKRESDSMVRSLFEAAPLAIIISDLNGQIVMANPGTEKIFGYSPEELTQLSVEVLVPEQSRGKHTAHRADFFAHPQTRAMGLNMDLRARRRDASEFHAEVSLSYIDTEQGKLAVAFASDISRRRADEQAIREQREELRQLAGRLMTAQDDERRRIARDLHDDLSQRLARLAMDIGKLAAREGFEDAAPHLRPMQRHAAEAAELVRSISHRLHPSILDDLGLKAALEEFCSEFEERTGVSTDLIARDIPDPLPAEISSCIYYVAGECLHNIAKHAQAHSATVAIEVTGTTLSLRVKDDGIGFSRNARSRGIGVASMKERVRYQGGRITIQSDPGEGTMVTVDVPIRMG